MSFQSDGPIGPVASLFRHVWKALLFIGVCTVVLGILAFVWPGRTAEVVGVIFAIYLFILGIGNVAAGLSAPMPGLVRALTLVAGVLAIILGVTCLLEAPASVSLLGTFIGIGWLMGGIARLSFGAMGGGLRGLAILSGVLLILGGLVLIISPISSVVTLAWVSGIFLVAGGAAEIGHALALRRYIAR